MAAKKYHVTNAGPKPCNASKRACRYGSEVHFENREAARAFYEEKLSQEEGGPLKTLKKKVTPQTEAAPRQPSSKKALSASYAAVVAHEWARNPELVEENYGQRFDSVAEVEAAARQEYSEVGEAATYHKTLEELGGEEALGRLTSLSKDFDPRKEAEGKHKPVSLVTASDKAVQEAQLQSDQAKEAYENARAFAREFPFASQEEKREAMEETNSLFEVYRQQQEKVEEALSHRRELAELAKNHGFSTDPLLVEAGPYHLSLQELPTGSTSYVHFNQKEDSTLPLLSVRNIASGPVFSVKEQADLPGLTSEEVQARKAKAAEVAVILTDAYRGPIDQRGKGTPAWDEEKLRLLPTKLD